MRAAPKIPVVNFENSVVKVRLSATSPREYNCPKCFGRIKIFFLFIKTINSQLIQRYEIFPATLQKRESILIETLGAESQKNWNPRENVETRKQHVRISVATSKLSSSFIQTPQLAGDFSFPRAGLYLCENCLERVIVGNTMSRHVLYGYEKSVYVRRRAGARSQSHRSRIERERERERETSRD